ncbi:autotransporter adhesin [Rhizobium sp. SORGH_AS 787]|nr:autotransporter adhesin [Rhizobium sp. SORGH_AS_0787]
MQSNYVWSKSLSGGPRFIYSWLPSGTDSRTHRRRLMAVLRMAFRVIGMGRGRLGVGCFSVFGVAITGAMVLGDAPEALAGTCIQGTSINTTNTGGNSPATCDQFSIAIGGGSGATATGISVAIGDAAGATGENSTALGRQTKALGDFSVAIGQGSNATETNTIAIGRISRATGTGATALGANSNAANTNAVAVGLNSSATGSSSLALGSSSSASGQGAIALGNGASAANAGAVALGQGSTTAAAIATSGTTIAGQNYSFAGTAPTSTVSIGAVGAERTLTNLAAGRLSSTSTDAVNGSQLFATNQAVNKVDGKVDTMGNSVASVFGGGTVYDSATGKITGNFNYAGSSYGSVQNVFDQINGSINGGSGIKYFHANSSLADSVATGTNSVAIGPQASSGGANSVALGNNAQANGTNSVALGANSVAGNAVATTSTVINGKTYDFAGGAPVGTISVGDAGSERTITNVAAGRVTADSTDAVNGSQLHATNSAVEALAQDVGSIGEIAENAVVYDKNADGSRANSVSLIGGDPNTPVVVRNVAAGTAPTDAVNVGQLTDGLSSTLTQSKTYTDQVAGRTLDQANAYTDQRFNQLSADVSGAVSEARQAAAIGLAAASLRYDDRPGKLSLGVGGGFWRGEGALAFGAGYTSEDQRFRTNISATTSDGNWGVGAGLTMTLN